MNKKLLYESIMRNVSIEVKKVLNEGFNFEPAKVFDSFIKAFGDERLKDIVAEADCASILELVKECKKMIDSDCIPEKAPMKISSISTLAGYVLNKHFDEEAIAEFKEYDNAEINDVANCVCNEINGGNCNCAEEGDSQRPAQASPRALPECGCDKKKPEVSEPAEAVGECNGAKKTVKECNESLSARRRRRMFFK